MTRLTITEQTAAIERIEALLATTTQGIVRAALSDDLRDLRRVRDQQVAVQLAVRAARAAGIR